MCISRSHTEISLPSSSVQAHLLGYPWKLAKMWGCILASSYCSRKVSTSKCQSVYVTSVPGSVDLKDQHIQSYGCQPFSLPAPSVAPAPMPVACSLTCSGVSIRFWGPSVREGGGQTLSTNCSALGLWWPSVQLCCPCMGGEPSLCHLFYPGGSSDLLWCTSHQLA